MSKAPVYYIPTESDVRNLKAGDLALNAFGEWRKVTRISCCREDIHGKWFVCYATEFGPGSELTGSMKEGELQRTVALSNLHTSRELDQIEGQMLECAWQPPCTCPERTAGGDCIHTADDWQEGVVR